jgi:uncharacterized protein YkwD
VRLSTLRTRLALLLAVVALVGLSGCLSPDEQSLYDLLNAERSGAGLRYLDVDGDAQDKAQAWAQTLASEGRLAHSSLVAGIGGTWQRLGENVGSAGSIEELHRALMASAGHRTRILDGGYTHVGVGVAQDSSGRYYASQVFVRR